MASFNPFKILEGTGRLTSSIAAAALLLAGAIVSATSLGYGSIEAPIFIRLLLLCLTFALALSATVLSAFSNLLGGARANAIDYRAVSSLCLCFLIGLDIFVLTPLSTRATFLTAMMIGQTGFVYVSSRYLVSLVQLAGPLTKRVPRLAAAAVLFVSITSYIADTWFSLEITTAFCSFAREVILFLVPTAMLLYLGWSPSLRLDSRSLLNSIKLRLGSSESKASQTMSLYVVFAALTAAMALYRLLSPTGMKSVPIALNLGTIAMVFQSIQDLTNYLKAHKHTGLTTRLTAIAARKFLDRHLKDRPAWAATVGLRTSNFVVDHDPDNVLQDHLPATLMQIRSEEIQRCILELLGPLFLHNHVVGHRIYGSLDPEASTRPCVDVLKMVSCLYLDAGPLIERRLNGLGQLLPFIDPGLARILRLDDINRLIKRNQWFFHFDYGWVDQHVVHTPNATRYSVQIGTISSETRNSMLDYLKNKSSLGNFVWIGSDARDRLLQEAPVLANVIEPCPVPQHGQSSELLVFIIRFEQLIPRLQRYFDLDSARKVLLDFDPSREATKLLNLLGSQLSAAKTGESIDELISGLTSYPWRGFKEKDHALRLILEAFKLVDAQALANPADDLASETNYLAMRKRLLAAVDLVGYPSQILHHAQIDKIALRDIKQLIDVAGNKSHSRFEESWLLLSTADPGRFKPEERKQLMHFLSSVGQRSGIKGSSFVQIKAIDALTALSRKVIDEELTLFNQTVCDFARWLSATQANTDALCLFLDSIRFMQTHLRLNITLDADSIRVLEDYFQELNAKNDQNKSLTTALLSRWKELNVTQVVPLDLAR